MNVWVLLIVIGIVLLIALGMWGKIYTWFKSALKTTTGQEIPTSLDAQLTTWLTTAKSAKVQGLLRLARIEFAAREDDKAVSSLDALITLAATWDDPLVASETTDLEKQVADLQDQIDALNAAKTEG